MPTEPSPDTPIEMGTAVEATLEPTDRAALEGVEQAMVGYSRDGHVFEGTAGSSVIIDLSCNFDGILYLVGPDGQIGARNDDHHSINNSRIVATLSQSGPHRIVVTTYAPGETGLYVLILTTLVPAP